MLILDEIVKYIKKIVPLEAVLPSENITTPKTGEYSDCYPTVTIHIDGFLYTDDQIQDLVDAGKVKQHYRVDCGSKNVNRYIIIFHSLSRDAVFHIFNTWIPPMKNNTVLDVGSRLGTVLYGAYVFTDAKKIIGIETNEEFYKLQRYIIRKHRLNDRVQVLHKRIEERTELVKESDVIVINNAFEFHLSESEQRIVWNFLKENMREGTFLVTRPLIPVTRINLKLDIDVQKWLSNVPRGGKEFSHIENDELFDVECYIVRKR
ncbi:hypothetical protein KM043_001692 [Ampulex compressa]|nr:hypothetical protein KM043_001692 [Ampulex compressa]